MKKKGYSLLSVIIIVIVTAVVSGLTIGTILTKNAFLFQDENKIQDDKDLKEFLTVYNKIKNEYYEKVDSKELIDGAISGMLNEIGDSYTSLLTDESASDLLETLNGTYKGVGITIKDHEIVNTVVNSPAEKSGILPGDIIKSVNGNDVTSLSTSEISDMIASENNKVTLVILRGDVELSFELTVEVLNVPSVSYRTLENTDIGYIKIAVFSKNVSKEIESALKTLKNNNVKGFIIDLRGNNGGYLEEAKKSAALFLKKNKIIYSLQTQDGIKNYKDLNKKNEKLPIVVLINKGTASSAEILAAALKDSYNAILVGTTSYGKGKVQYTYTLSDGSMAKYTTSKWLRATGECIDEIGIKPDYIINNEYIFDPVNPNMVIDTIDNQLNEAVKLLSN